MRRHSPRFMDRGMKMWIVKYAKKNLWRVPVWMDLDDVIAEGYLAYAITAARYGDRVANKRHFQALLMVIFTNQLTEISNAKTKCPEIVISQMGGEDTEELTQFEKIVGGAEGDAELAALLASAPEEIRKFMRLLNDPAALEKLQRPLRYKAGGQRNTTNARIARMAEIDPDFDVEEALSRLVLGKGAEEHQWANFFKSVFGEMDSPIYYDTAGEAA